MAVAWEALLLPALSPWLFPAAVRIVYSEHCKAAITAGQTDARHATWIAKILRRDRLTRRSHTHTKLGLLLRWKSNGAAKIDSLYSLTLAVCVVCIYCWLSTHQHTHTAHCIPADTAYCCWLKKNGGWQPFLAFVAHRSSPKIYFWCDM